MTTERILGPLLNMVGFLVCLHLGLYQVRLFAPRPVPGRTRSHVQVHVAYHVTHQHVMFKVQRRTLVVSGLLRVCHSWSASVTIKVLAVM